MREGTTERRTSLVGWVSRALAASALGPALFRGWSWLTSPRSMLAHLDRGLLLVSVAAWALRAGPALVLSRRRPWAALATVLPYPAVRVAILSCT